MAGVGATSNGQDSEHSNRGPGCQPAVGNGNKGCSD
jgi:hypothetical protein